MGRGEEEQRVVLNNRAHTQRSESCLRNEGRIGKANQRKACTQSSKGPQLFCPKGPHIVVPWQSEFWKRQAPACCELCKDPPVIQVRNITMASDFSFLLTAGAQPVAKVY
jgi:hypothetical protein